MVTGLLLYRILLWFQTRSFRKVSRCAGKVRRLSLLPCTAGIVALLYVPLSLATVYACAQPTEILSRIFQPFEDVIALLVALVFGTGILGFVILLVDAFLNWITGGSFGRSLAVTKIIRAVETLVVFPLAFFVVNVLKELGVPEVAAVADVANSLLSRGWQLVLSVLRGG